MVECTPSGVPRTARGPNEEPFAVSFTLCLDDYLEAMLWMRRRPEFAAARVVQALFDMVVTVPLCGLVGYAAAWVLGQSDWPDAVGSVTIGAIFGGIGLAFASEARLRDRRLRRGLQRQLRAVPGVDADDPQLRQRAGFAVDAFGVESRVPSRETRVAWSALFGLDETDTLFLPHTGRHFWTVVPKREVPTADLDRLRLTSQAKLAAAERRTARNPPAFDW